MGNRIILVPGLAGLSDVAPAFEQFKPPMSPVELTPRSPYVMARAALVFGSPHTLSPADNLAEFGRPFDSKENPHPGSGVWVWFKPPRKDQKYNLVFTCHSGAEGYSYKVESSDKVGFSESTPAQSSNTFVPVTFLNTWTEWLWFGVTFERYWKFVSVNISELPS